MLDNDGTPFEDETWSWWRDEITKVTGGVFLGSELGLAQGHWEGCADHCRWVMAVISKDTLPDVRRFLKAARLRFRQMEMYLDFHPVQLESVKPSVK